MDNRTQLSPLKQAFLALQEAQARIAELERERHEPVAIIGLSCRIPGAPGGVEGYWSLLRNGVNAITSGLPERWRVSGAQPPNCAVPEPAEFGALLDNVDLFEPQLFGISPREAVSMDPQQRLLLEVSWEALESAGMSPAAAYGTRTGVYFGICTTDYSQIQLGDGGAAAIDSHFASGIAHSIASGRLSYVLGLQGPSMSLDTACSSSLVAIHLACGALRNGDCRVALAGGVNLVLTPECSISYAQAGMLAHDGQCKAFDASADGFVRGEGCGIVVLKRLKDALADGDPVMAVIRGSALNQDGPSSGLTVPNGMAQQSLVRQALAQAGIEPAQVSYVEAHGTGTSLGDPIEAEALGTVFSTGRDRNRPLLIGSVKTNIGHLEAAAGVAGLIKLVLGLQHREIPPQLHFQQPSPHIRWRDLPLKVVTEPTPWEPIGGRRIAGVSSFGFSGTNAHIIVEEAPVREPQANDRERPIHILTATARTQPSLCKLAEEYAAYLENHPTALWEDICHTTLTGRSHLAHRLSLRAADASEGAAHLRAFLNGEKPAALVTSHVRLGYRPKVAFLFTGQGSQFAGMGRELYAASPRFREILDRCDEILKGELEAPLGAVMRGEHPDAAALLDQTLYTQPALFAFEYAMAELWRSWGVEPGAVLGHSLGEFVAAAIAGVFSLEDGLRLVAERARLMHNVREQGAMLAVEATEEEVAAELAGHERQVSLAAVNGPRQVVISGASEAVAAMEARLIAQGRQTKRLRVLQAFHSPLMESIESAFEIRAGELKYATPRIRLLSNVTGNPIDRVNANYWRRHLRQPVRFQAEINTLEELGYEVLIEVGPRPTLIALAQQGATAGWGSWIPSLRNNVSEWESLARAVQDADAAGVEVDWAGWDRGYQRRRVSLPVYPFDRQPYWVKINTAKRPGSRGGIPMKHPLLGVRLRSALEGAQYETHLETHGATGWIADHRLGGRVIMPATGYLEMMLAAGIETYGEDWRELRDVAFLQPLEFAGEDGRTVQVVVDAPQGDSAKIRVFGADAGEDNREHWRLYVEARIAKTRPGAPPIPEPSDDIRQRCAGEQESSEFYDRLRLQGAEFGPEFRNVQRVWHRDSEALGQIRTAGEHSYRIHPAILDACFQVSAAAAPDLGKPQELRIPVSLARFHFYASPAGPCLAHVRLTHTGQDTTGATIDITGPEGALVAQVEGLRFRLARDTTSESELRSWFYQLAWQPAPPPVVGAAVSGTWLVTGAHDRAADSAAAALTARGLRVTRSLDGPLNGVLYFSTPEPLSSGASVTDSARPAITGLLDLFHKLTASASAAPRVFVITRNAHPVGPGAPAPDVAQAPVWGMASAVAVEHPELRCTRIDLEAGDVSSLIAEVLANSEDDWVAYRHGTRYLPRLERCEMSDAPLRLTSVAGGGLEDLKYQPVEREQPGPREIEIRVEAAGLNFHDVLNAVGVLSDTDPLGAECAGTVVRAGASVKDFQPGDEVVAIANRSFCTFNIAHEELAIPKPAGLSFEEAAAQAIGYLTADHCLNAVAGMKAGDRVLIHAATGGVGLAAVYLCLRAGAEVFATAGSEPKRELLRSLGITHVMDSRSLEFQEQVLAATQGGGVDIVLNSLAGEFIAAGLAVTAPGGRFIEIGRTGIRTSEEVTREFPGVNYVVVDLTTEFSRNAPAMRARLRSIFDELSAKSLPLLPHRTFPMTAVVDAFRHMAMAKHTGKVVLTAGSSRNSIRVDGAYIVTGGLTGLGLKVAGWLAESGAGSILLAGRRAPSEQAQQAMAAMRKSGARVEAVQADVADPDQLQRVLDAAEEQPIRGIVHCAAVWDDAPMVSLNWDRFVPGLRAKADGAWNLHRLTEGQPLDFFVMFSSVASLAGSPGQANYCASNAFLDSLAHYRRSQGLPAFSINWGAWSEVGFAANDSQTQRLAGAGMKPMSPEEALRALDLTLRKAPAPQVGIFPIHWSQYFTFMRGRPGTSVYSNFAAPASEPGNSQNEPKPELLQQWTALPPAKREAALSSFVRDQAARVLGLRSGAEIDPDQPLKDFGMDSLIAVELRNQLSAALVRTIPATILFDHPTARALTGYLAQELFGSPPAPEPAPRSEDPVDMLDRIEQLSDEEVESLFSGRAVNTL